MRRDSYKGLKGYYLDKRSPRITLVAPRYVQKVPATPADHARIAKSDAKAARKAALRATQANV